MMDSAASAPEFLTTVQRVVRVARQIPHRPAMVGHDDIVHSYADVLAGLARFTAALAGLGVREGEVVGLECPYHPHHVYLRLACQALGAVTTSFVPADLHGTDAAARRCDLIIFTDPGCVVRSARSHRITPAWLAEVARRPVRDEDLARLETPWPPERIVRLLKTSGTTGESKIITLSDAAMQSRWDVYHELYQASRHSVFSDAYAAGTENGSGDAILAFLFGAFMVFAQPERLPEAFHRYRVSESFMMLIGAEALLARIPPGWPKPARLRLCIWAGRVMPNLRAALLARVGTAVESYYAARETGLVAVMDDDGSGRILRDTEVEIRDADFRPVAEGEDGLICVRSPRLASAYLDHPQATQAAFRDGWFLTSDLGRKPAPDRLVLLGRIDDMLNIGGVKVPAGHVEAELRDIPGVAEAALVAIRGALGVDQMAVMLEVPPGLPVDPILAEAGRQTARFADCKIVTVHQIPRTDTGKISKYQVERWFRRQLGLPDA